MIGRSFSTDVSFWRQRLSFLTMHLRECKSFQFIRLRILLEFRLMVNLLALKLKVSLNHPLNSPHVWIAIDVKCSDKLGNICWILPLLNSFEQAEVNKKDSWSSTDTRGAMEVHCMVLLVQHIIEVLGCHKKTRTEFIFVSVLNRESLAKDTVLSICKFKFVPRYSSLLDICFRLQVENTSDTSFAHLFDIIIS